MLEYGTVGKREAEERSIIMIGKDMCVILIQCALAQQTQLELHPKEYPNLWFQHSPGALRARERQIQFRLEYRCISFGCTTYKGPYIRA